MLIDYKKLPFNPKLRERARELRNNMTLSEVILWKQLYRKSFFGLNFDRQKIIGNYIVDFYCPDIGMVVEVDGCTHDCKEEYDKKRHEYLESLGLVVVHLDDMEIKTDLGWQLSILSNKTKERMKQINMPFTEGPEFVSE
ncbi:MAG: DUF559 domain-containing protein [Alphaproteobacteria bacterium]|nr:DUF559 domain-containing protein [Alphaproteobacteria bacterium]